MRSSSAGAGCSRSSAPNAPTDAAERAANLTFVIVGGGPTGVELAGMLPTIARFALPKDFRHIDTAAAQNHLARGWSTPAADLSRRRSRRARRAILTELGVDVRTNTFVTDVGDDFVEIGAERIESRTIFWAAGNAASSIGASLGVDRATGWGA